MNGDFALRTTVSLEPKEELEVRTMSRDTKVVYVLPINRPLLLLLGYSSCEFGSACSTYRHLLLLARAGNDPLLASYTCIVYRLEV